MEEKVPGVYPYEEVKSLYIDFERETVEINGKRLVRAVVVGLPQSMKDGTLMHRLLVNPEDADGKKLLPRIEVTFDPGSLREREADERLLDLQDRAFRLLDINLQKSGAVELGIT